MAASTTVKNFTDGSVTIKDSTGSPITTGAISYSNGDFSVSGLAERWNEVSAYESRGVFVGLRHTTRTYPSGSFSVMLTEFTNATAGNPIDAVLKNGAFASGVSGFGTGSALPWGITIVFTIEGTNFGDDADPSATFTKCRATLDISEGDPDSITINWTSYGTPTGDLAPTAPA